MTATTNTTQATPTRAFQLSSANLGNGNMLPADVRVTLAPLFVPSPWEALVVAAGNFCLLFDVQALPSGRTEFEGQQIEQLVLRWWGDAGVAITGLFVDSKQSNQIYCVAGSRLYMMSVATGVESGGFVDWATAGGYDAGQPLVGAAAAGDDLYLLDRTGAVHKIKTLSGELRPGWPVCRGTGSVTHGPLIDGTTLYYIQNDTLYGIDTEDGRELWPPKPLLKSCSFDLFDETSGGRFTYTRSSSVLPGQTVSRLTLAASPNEDLPMLFVAASDGGREILVPMVLEAPEGTLTVDVFGPGHEEQVRQGTSFDGMVIYVSGLQILDPGPDGSWKWAVDLSISKRASLELYICWPVAWRTLDDAGHPIIVYDALAPAGQPAVIPTALPWTFFGAARSFFGQSLPNRKPGTRPFIGTNGAGMGMVTLNTAQGGLVFFSSYDPPSGVTWAEPGVQIPLQISAPPTGSPPPEGHPPGTQPDVLFVTGADATGTVWLVQFAITVSQS